MATYYSISTADLEETLAMYIAARKSISTGQNYSIEGQSVSRADLAEVNATINELSRELNNRHTANTGGRPGILTPKW